MRVAGHTCRPSWAGLFTIALVGVGRVQAVELDVESDGESNWLVDLKPWDRTTDQRRRLYQTSLKRGRDEHDVVLHW